MKTQNTCVEALDNGDALLRDIEDYLDGLADGAPDAPGYAKQATVLLEKLQREKRLKQCQSNRIQAEMERIAEICDNTPEQRYEDIFSLKLARQHNVALNEIRRIAGQFLL